MAEHPIEGLMLTAMNSIKDMIDVDTIIGEPIQALNDIVVIPISKVSFGFAAGGSEFKGETVNEYKKQEKDEQIQYRLPFGGGAGAGVSLSPVAFLVVQGDMVKLLPVNHSTSLDKILDYIPDLFEKVKNMANKSMQCKKEQTDKIISTIQKNCKKDKDSENVEAVENDLTTKIQIDQKDKNEGTKIKEQIKIEDLDDEEEAEFEEEIVYDEEFDEDDE